MLESLPTDAETAMSSQAAGGRRLLAGAAMLGGMIVLVKLMAFAKDWMVALRFGASDELDAFLVALVVPSYAVVVAQSFSLAFMPAYIRIWQRDGSAAAQGLTAGVLGGGLAVLVAVTLSLTAAAPLLLDAVASGFDSAKLALAVRLYYVLAALLVAGGLSAMFGAVLNAHERFGATALAPLALPTCTLAVFWLGRDRYGIYALAAGTLLGFLAECAILAIAMRLHGLLPWPTWRYSDPSTRRVARQYLSVATGSLLMSSSMVVDQSMAATLASGSVSILNYGNKIVALILGIVAVSLSTVLFPRFSKVIAQGDWPQLDRMLGGFWKLIFVYSVPAVVLLVVFSEPLMRLVFERGAFTPQTTAAASEVQRWLLPQIPFYIIVMVGFRLLSALDCSHIVLRIGALNLLLNVTGNYVFMHWFGVKGIAMSTSLVYMAATAATLAAVHFKLAEHRPSAVRA
jgi:putative peptidoglycan lipid II flippase